MKVFKWVLSKEKFHFRRNTNYLHRVGSFSIYVQQPFFSFLLHLYSQKIINGFVNKAMRVNKTLKVYTYQVLQWAKDQTQRIREERGGRGGYSKGAKVYCTRKTFITLENFISQREREVAKVDEEILSLFNDQKATQKPRRQKVPTVARTNPENKPYQEMQVYRVT